MNTLLTPFAWFPDNFVSVFNVCNALLDHIKLETTDNNNDKKIKKKEDKFQLQLVKTKDIAATFGGLKKPNQFFVGFALETDNELNNAKDKLARKNFDLIVLNSLNDKGAGFGHDTNQITIVDN